MGDELVQLCPEIGLFLKPLARVSISIIIPEKSIIGKTISNWELMETIKKKISPETFLSIKVCVSSFSKVVLEGEVKSINQQGIVLKKLDGGFIKLSGFQDRFQVNASACKLRTLKRNDWEAFFKEAKDMDPEQPGERADTVYISGLPISWFKDSDGSSMIPSEACVRKTFGKFGEILRIDIPSLDEYRDRINSFIDTGADIYAQSNGFRKTTLSSSALTFDAYIQYSDYDNFCDCMNALNGMKLVRIKLGDKNSPYFSNFELDFDRKKHLSEKNILLRDKIRNDLIEQDQQKQKKLDDERMRLNALEEEKKKKEEEEMLQKASIEAKQIKLEKERKLKEIQRELQALENEKRDKVKVREENRRKRKEEKYNLLEKRVQNLRGCRLHAAETLLTAILSHIERKMRRSSKASKHKEKSNRKSISHNKPSPSSHHHHRSKHRSPSERNHRHEKHH